MSASILQFDSTPTSPLRLAIEAALQRAAQFDPGCPPHLAEAVRYSLLAPGKRLRPQLTVLAAQACGSPIEAALPAAIAVEMVHAYSLVHDDLPAMDNDDLRRGRPTCHRQFDEGTAILVGDALLTRAFEVLATEIEPAERSVRCCATLAKSAGAAALVGGQADDLAAENRRVGLARLQSIHERKTGALFQASLRMGAIVAGASLEQEAALIRYGERLGLAFQIVDDLLDVAGTEAAVGKRLGQDRRHGKATYVALLGIAKSRRRVEELVGQAVESLAVIGPLGQPLADLAIYVGKRTT